MCTVLPMGIDVDVVIASDDMATLPEGERFLGVSPDGGTVAVRDEGGGVELRPTAAVLADEALGGAETRHPPAPRDTRPVH